MKQAEKHGKKNKVGAIGEEIAASYLKKNGFTIIEVNYLKKWGELDIVAHETHNNKEIIHFVELYLRKYDILV